MEMLEHADRLRAQGRDIVTLGLGEPIFAAPDAVQQAAIEAMRAGLTTYSPALGLPELRSAIAGFYRGARGLDIDPARIVSRWSGSSRRTCSSAPPRCRSARRWPASSVTRSRSARTPRAPQVSVAAAVIAGSALAGSADLTGASSGDCVSSPRADSACNSAEAGVITASS